VVQDAIVRPVLPRAVMRAAFFVVSCMLGFTVLATAGFALSIRPHRYISAATPAQHGWAYEAITLRTEDDLKLSAWLIPAAAETRGRSAVIVLHGYPYSKGDVLGITPFLHDQHDLLLLDMRYFGGSEGTLTTLGHHEWRDVAAGVRLLKDRGYASVGVWGISMGASVALLTLAREAGIDAVVADSPYSDLHEMTLDYYLRLPVMAPILATITDLLARAVIGVAPADVSPARAAAASRKPILLIHGADDRTIPLHHHERMRAGLGPHANVQTWLIAGAGHGQGYPIDKARYEARVLDFFSQHLG
jgi:dipeptidyl aminopeptidase/acylaminoacyl peptidase